MFRQINGKDLLKLKEPISPKWRVQSTIKDQSGNPTSVIMIPYIDARDVQDLLDKVVGMENWQSDYFEIKGKQFCRIGIRIGEEWVWKSDNGTASNTEKEKGETSDSFKRAAVHWGINRSAYNYGTVKLPAKPYGKNAFPVNEAGKFIKGDDLYKLCNKMAKVDEFEELYNTMIENSSYGEPEIDPKDQKAIDFINAATDLSKLSSIKLSIAGKPSLIEAYEKKEASLRGGLNRYNGNDQVEMFEKAGK